MAFWGATRTSALLGVFLFSGNALLSQDTAATNCALTSDSARRPKMARATPTPVGAQGAHLQAPPNSTEMPTLEDTISFMNKSVAPEKGFVSSANRCELYVTRNRLYKFAIPGGTGPKSVDEYGISRSTVNWMVVDEPASVIRFNLKSIDPTSINSKPAWSIPFLQEHANDSGLPKGADLMLVTFETANSEPSIELGRFMAAADGKSSTPVFDQKKDMALIVFESKDRAERFVTAFIHAVDLCGGKGVEFAPTPSKP